ncbi:MAG: hypothetical protein ACI39W_08015 [Brotaphodocola sp.]
MRFWKKFGSFACVCTTVMALSASPAFAGQWEPLEDGNWKYEENGKYLTGWQRVDGVWYYMDPDTELWVERPQLNDESVCYLLENAVNQAGWYRNEDKEMYYQIDSSNPYQYTVSLMVSTEPCYATGTMNTFDISRKTGLAKSQSTKLVLNLYD